MGIEPITRCLQSNIACLGHVLPILLFYGFMVFAKQKLPFNHVTMKQLNHEFPNAVYEK